MDTVSGQIFEGKVTGITKFGAFVDFDNGKTGMVHISEVANKYVEKIEDCLELNQVVKVKIINVSEDGKIALSIKQAQRTEPKARKAEPKTFEEMMSKFKQSSEERISEINRATNRKTGVRRRGKK